LGCWNNSGGLPWITDAKTDFDKAVAPNARAHRERDAGVEDLEVGHLETLAAARDLAPSRQGSRTELNAERRASLGRRNNDDGSLNLEHRNLLEEQT
jgi:hypothetical protein